MGTTSHPIPFPLLPSHLSSAPFLPFKIRALNRAGGSGECCKIPQRGLGQSPGRPGISAQFQLKRWPLVALKSGVQYHPFPHTHTLVILVSPYNYDCSLRCSLPKAQTVCQKSYCGINCTYLDIIADLVKLTRTTTT